MTRGAGGWLAGALAAALLSGCAVFADPGRVAPGTPVAGVVEQLGRPTARYPAAGSAGERLQYTYQPAGQRVFNIDLDAQGRVARVEQALSVTASSSRSRWRIRPSGDAARSLWPPAAGKPR